MANTINGINGSSAASVGTTRAAKQTHDNAAASAGDGTPADAGDVHITSTASKLATLGQTLSAMPEVDQARVAKFSSAIQAGTYTISPDKIANGLIQSDRALAQLGIEEQ